MSSNDDSATAVYTLCVLLVLIALSLWNFITFGIARYFSPPGTISSDNHRKSEESEVDVVIIERHDVRNVFFKIHRIKR